MFELINAVFFCIDFYLALTSLQIEQENTQLTNDLYRLLKKYAGLRNIIRNLKVSHCTVLKSYQI